MYLIFIRVYLFQMQTTQWAKRKPLAHLACPKANSPSKALDFEKLQLQDTLLCGTQQMKALTWSLHVCMVLRAEPNIPVTRPQHAHNTTWKVQKIHKQYLVCKGGCLNHKVQSTFPYLRTQESIWLRPVQYCSYNENLHLISRH